MPDKHMKPELFNELLASAEEMVSMELTDEDYGKILDAVDDMDNPSRWYTMPDWIKSPDDFSHWIGTAQPNKPIRCRACHGTGQHDHEPCPNCNGTGTVRGVFEGYD